MRTTTIHVVELIILGICFLSLGMMKAEACDCDKPRLGKTALEEADAVFSGRITVSLRQNGVGPNKTCADAILPKGHS